MSTLLWRGERGFAGEPEILWEDGERTFCKVPHAHSNRGRDGLIAVFAGTEHQTPGSVDRLAHEYALKDYLESAWALRPLELLNERGQTILVVEAPDGEPLVRHIGSPMELAIFLPLAVSMSVALGRLHERGFVHKDVKPANVMINVADGKAWLTGFGIASHLPREHQAPEPPEYIAGTLPYMAPEQTGRINRSINSRSDLYSLGISLYQMLTGALPFSASDPMEWVHCHVARRPESPKERLTDIPDAVSAIIMKLLAKTPEERYQTAAGVESDLQRCLAAWRDGRAIDAFELGEHDKPDRLMVPEKLYGRTREVDTLLTSFDRVAAGGKPELLLVSGYSGIGKSSVVNELHRILVAPRGLFASGKFDQYKRDIPCATLAQAFQSLIRPLLGKAEAELRTWREDLGRALSPNGALIVDLVPELKFVIGEQPAVPELPPQDMKARFQQAIRQFIGVFARPEHPLALFVDDLQWLDAATLDVLEDLLVHPDVKHLMVVGAYRDNEVGPAHPLTGKLETIRASGATVREIILAPLTDEDLTQLVADSLRCEAEQAAPLASSIYDKTGGNPFFAIQFISSLAEEGLLSFDQREGSWRWDLNDIRAKGYTDNVVDLMVGRLSRLPATAQRALQRFACIGNSADFAVLSIVHDASEHDVHAALWEALRVELVVRLTGSYKFAHDRVHEAAYSLIAEDLRAENHLTIGRRLAAGIPPERREEAIFEIVNQLNRGAALIASQDERDQLAEFNLLAGKRAQASTAYVSALGYFSAGSALLADDGWQHRHELAFALEFGRAQCEFISGALTEAEEHLGALAVHAAATVERTTVAGLRVDLYMSIDQSERAIAIGLAQLRDLGIDWSPRPTEEDAKREYERVWALLAGRKIEDLVDLPMMTDPASLVTLDLLIRVAVPGFFASSYLFALAVCKAVNVSLERGNCDASCIAYGLLAMLAGPYFDDYDAGYRFGQAC